MIPRAWAWLVVLAAAWQVPEAAAAAKTRLVTTKYGQVQGLIRHLGHLLGDVEVFMGVPYASPPVEEGRFTPTNTPTPWDGVLDATTPPPVCPQLLPDPDEAHMPKARAEFIRKVSPALINQSEDCLTVNIYTPIMVIPGSEVYPVLVYLHGESFSWGAGSLYDGSVLAAYGRVVVLTLNYRLGPLGFLNTYGGGTGGVVSNFALLDQIAALNWVSENIQQFNGDPKRVTLFGRDTGAACISYLMESPIVPQDLFHRVVMVSGWSGCPWSRVSAPLSVTLRLAVAAGCPVPDDPAAAHPRTVSCLRSAPLEPLMSAARQVESPAFMPAWGPSEDGVVVAGGRRRASLGHRQVQVMIGFTPWEAWAWLGESLVTKGVNDITFERVARTWVRNTRHHHLREVLAAALQEYTDWTAVKPSPEVRRNLLFHLLGDAGMVAPLHQAADALAHHNKVFMFLCDLASRVPGQIQAPGWELGLIWGTGLSDVTRSAGAPSPPIRPPALTQLSEDVITLLTNFAKSGDPNLPRESPSPGFAAVAWPRYKPETRQYLRIGVPPTVGSQYRAHQLALWSWLVPELEAAGKSYPPDPNSWEVSTDPNLFYGVVKPPDPWYFLQPNTTIAPAAARDTTTTTPATPSPKPTTPRVTTTLALSPTIASSAPKMPMPDSSEYVRYSTALLVTVGLGVSLLLLNGLIFLLLFWRRPTHHPTCQGHHHHTQEGSDMPRVGSMMSLGGLGGSYGGPPDCVKASYEKLHLTADEIQHLTSRSPSSTLKRPKSPGNLKNQGSFRASHGVATISRSPRGVVWWAVIETSFTVEPPTLLRDGGNQTAAHEDTLRAWSVPREISPGTVVGANGNGNGGGGGSGTLMGGNGGDGRPNGWATFVGEVPEPPPPPRTSTLRKDKKVTILEQTVHRL
ncbi:carboxylesterase 4A-like isoform X3 [Homarus americanus]|uniref:carboxylesterase 4A-like isoform X3 n=1 Tax=Homarus americanus TaxID=6706 RepID=UPI001C46A028|nr:carboxylesterase 4A-like isoform X3 [Homarus americanus]